MQPATLDLSTSHGAHIAQRLRDDLIIWLATVRPDGRPHLVPVWFLWDGEAILIFSQPNQKMRSDVVTIEGVAELLPSGSVTVELAPYSEKYAGRLQAMRRTPQQMAQSYTEAIRITPTRFL